jgi:hypothetical protein
MSPRRRQALEMLAAAGWRGSPDPLLLARFTLQFLDLLNDGLATAWPETVRARGRKVEGARVRITEAGQIAIKGRSALLCIEAR